MGQLHAKQQLRDSNITLDRVYTIVAEFLIELKLHEEQNKISQIVSGSSGTVKHSMYDEYINASKGKIPVKGKGKQGDGKGGKSNWRAACEDYTIGSQAVVLTRTSLSKVSSKTTSQADVLSVALLATTRLSAHIQSSLKPRLPSGMTQHGSMMKLNGKTECTTVYYTPTSTVTVFGG